MHLNEHFPLLLEILFKSAAVLALAALASGAWRCASAANRHAIWVAALLALLLLPFTKLASPRWAYVWHRDADTRAASGLPPIIARIKLPERHGESSPGNETRPTQQMAAVVDWAGIGVFGWLVGVALVAAHRAAVRWRLGALVRGSRSVCDQRVQVLMEEIGSASGIRPEVRESASCRVPLASGVWRPVVLLPTAALAWDDARLSAALHHEFGHIARRDCLTRLLLEVACALYWMNPLVWMAARAMRVAQEQACDDLVLQAGAPAADYARQLVDVVRDLGADRFSARHALAMAQPSTLETRVRSIVDETRDRRPLSRRAAAGGVVAVGAILALCGVAQLSGAEKKEEPPKNEPSTAVPETNAPLVEIESKFIEVSGSAAIHAALPWLPALPESGVIQGTLLGIFSDEQMQVAIRALNQAKGVDLLSAPRVTTRSKQRAVVEIIREFRYATEYEKGKKPGAWKPKAFETKNVGVTLAVEPTVHEAGNIELEVAPELVEFLGFRDFDAGVKAAPPRVDSSKSIHDGLLLTPDEVPKGHRAQPIFSTRKTVTSVSMWSGQTIILEGGTRDDVQVVEYEGAKAPETVHLKRRLLVFVTAKVIQPKLAGKSVPVETGTEKATGVVTASGKVKLETPRSAIVAGKEEIKPKAGDRGAPTSAALEKAGKIILPKIEFREASVREAVDLIRLKGVAHDPERKGVNIVLRGPENADPKITLNLTNVPLYEALKYVASLAGREISADPFVITLLPAEAKPAPFSKMPVRPAPAPGTPEAALMERAEKIVIPRMELKEATVGESVAFVGGKSWELDPEKKGVNIYTYESTASAGVRITMSFTNIPVSEALRYVAGLAGLELSVQDGGFHLLPKEE